MLPLTAVYGIVDPFRSISGCVRTSRSYRSSAASGIGFTALANVAFLEDSPLSLRGARKPGLVPRRVEQHGHERVHALAAVAEADDVEPVHVLVHLPLPDRQQLHVAIAELRLRRAAAEQDR